MVKRLISLVALLSALPAPAETFRIFGSAGYESQRAAANSDSPLNPGNFLRIPEQTNLGDVSLFGEASPESRHWRVRLKVRGNASDQGTDQVELGEGFLQLQATAWLDIAAGRIIEKWGSGYGWTPASFIGPAKNPTDPSDRRSADRGVDMIRADIFVRETNVSLYALEGSAFAARVYRMVGATDVSLYYRKDPDIDREGLSLSRVFGEALELHADLGRTNGSTRAVAGGQLTFSRDINLVFEVYHQDDGLSADEWRSFRDSVAIAGDAPALLAANGQYAPLRMGRDYGFLRLARPFTGQRLDAELIAITNLRDGSTIARAALTYEIAPGFKAYFIATELLGSADSELAYAQVKGLTTAGVRYYF